MHQLDLEREKLKNKENSRLILPKTPISKHDKRNEGHRKEICLSTKSTSPKSHQKQMDNYAKLFRRARSFREEYQFLTTA